MQSRRSSSTLTLSTLPYSYSLYRTVNPWIIPSTADTASQPYYCSFNGVKCMTDGCRKENYYVSDILLNGLSLSGNLPTAIGQFSKIKSFSVSNNVLGSVIPSEIGMWSSITSLSLDSNSLTGTVPNSIIQLTSLVSLNLSSNALAGSIPADIGVLTRLSYLNMGNSKITGTIPPSIGLLDNLLEFDVSNNKIEGSIPDSIVNLTKMKSLDLSVNTLSGRIPASFQQLREISKLNISNNYISNPTGPLVREEVFSQFLLFDDSSYCPNCFVIVKGGDVITCQRRDECPYRRPNTPTPAPTPASSGGKSSACHDRTRRILLTEPSLLPPTFPLTLPPSFPPFLSPSLPPSYPRLYHLSLAPSFPPSYLPFRTLTLFHYTEESPIYYLDDPVITDDDSPTFEPTSLRR